MTCSLPKAGEQRGSGVEFPWSARKRGGQGKTGRGFSVREDGES